MEIRINDRYTLTGSPEEMAILMMLMDMPEDTVLELAEDAPAPDPVEQEPEPKPEPAKKKPAPQRHNARKSVDWPKAKALRDAGWTYKEIARELHVSAQTVANHLGGKSEDEH